MLVVSLYGIQRAPEGVVGVVHESGTKKAYLHIPIISREPQMKTSLQGGLDVFAFAHTYCNAFELHWLENLTLSDI